MTSALKFIIAVNLLMTWSWLFASVFWPDATGAKAALIVKGYNAEMLK